MSRRAACANVARVARVIRVCSSRRVLNFLPRLSICFSFPVPLFHYPSSLFLLLSLSICPSIYLSLAFRTSFRLFVLRLRQLRRSEAPTEFRGIHDREFENALAKPVIVRLARKRTSSNDFGGRCRPIAKGKDVDSEIRRG